jgi:hypothetical protein
VDQEFNQMIANGGEIVDIIGVVPAECCVCQHCGGASNCPECGGKPEAQWLHTRGTITNFKSSFDWGMSQVANPGEISVSLSISGPTHWWPLNDVEWKFYGRNKPLYPLFDGTVSKNYHPYTPNWGGPEQSGYRKIVLDGSIMHDPANWIRGYSSVRNRRQRAIIATNDPLNPTISIPTPSTSTHVVDLPYVNWPAQPESLYYFSNLLTEGDISINVNTLTPHGELVETTASLDLDELNNITALGEEGILSDDSLIIGKYRGEYISQYLRNGTYPVDMYIPWLYSGGYPGETLIGRNEVSLVTTSDEGSIDFSYLHVFRRY